MKLRPRASSRSRRSVSSRPGSKPRDTRPRQQPRSYATTQRPPQLASALVMRIAVVSDIHANLHALETVLADIDPGTGDELWCLGDVVGYGPRPNECCDLIRDRAAIPSAGNHDLAVLGTSTSPRFSGEAATARAGPLRPGRRAAAHGWRRSAHGDGTGAELLHGSPRDPVWEYVLSEEVAFFSRSRPSAARARRPQHVALALGVGRRRRSKAGWRPAAQGRARDPGGACSTRAPRASARRRRACGLAAHRRRGADGKASGAWRIRSNRRRRRCAIRASRGTRRPARARHLEPGG